MGLNLNDATMAIWIEMKERSTLRCIYFGRYAGRQGRRTRPENRRRRRFRFVGQRPRRPEGGVRLQCRAEGRCWDGRENEQGRERMRRTERPQPDLQHSRSRCWRKWWVNIVHFIIIAILFVTSSISPRCCYESSFNNNKVIVFR